jgi:rhodanese-related sulfurtransferase
MGRLYILAEERMQENRRKQVSKVSSRVEELLGIVYPIHCAGGYRSSIAASILHHYGITNLIEMAGGLAAWDAAKLPVVSEA